MEFFHVAITGAQLRQGFEKNKSELQDSTKKLIADRLVHILSEYDSINPVLFINTGEEAIQSLRVECQITATCRLFWREIFLVHLAAKICPPNFAKAVKETMESMIFVQKPGGLRGVYIGFLKKIFIRLMFWL